MPHVVLIAWSFPPISNVASYRPLRVAKVLDQEGWDVTVVTGYPDSTIHRMNNQELLDHIPSNVKVVYLPDTSTSHEKNSVRPLSHALPARVFRKALRGTRSTIAHLRNRERIQALYSSVREIGYPTSKLDAIWHPKVLDTLEKLNQEQPIDLIWATIPPIASGIIAFVASDRLGVPYLLDYRDLWLENPFLNVSSEEHIPEHILLDHARMVSTVTEGFGETLAVKTSTPVRVLDYGFDPEIFDTVTKQHPISHSADTLMLIHAGTIYPFYDLDPIVKALENTDGKIMLHLYGNIVSRSQGRLIEDLPNIKAHGVVGNAEANQAVRDSDVMVIMSDETRPSVIPAKTFEALAFEMPTIYIGNTTDEAAQILLRCGLLISASSDLETLHEALLVAQNAKERGLPLCKPCQAEIEKHSYQGQREDYVALFTEALNESGPVQ